MPTKSGNFELRTNTVVCLSESWKIFEPHCLPYQWSEEALFSILYWCTYCKKNPKVFPKNL